MKTLIMFSIVVTAFTSCAIFAPQEMQEERRRLLALRDAARERHNPESVKQAVKDLLVGKWQYVGLEVEEGNVYANRTNRMPPQVADSPNAAVVGVPNSGSDGQTATPNVPEQEATAPDAETSEKKEDKEQNSEPEEGATRLPPVEVTDQKSNQRILGAKAALVASTRKNLTIEFFKEHGSYHYSGSNRGTNVTGQCYVTTKRYGDDPMTFIRFNQRTGPELLEFLFGSESIKQITAKQKQKRAAMTQNFNRKGALRATSRAIASIPGITVTDDTLSLVLYGDMQLTPTGWMRTGGLRCTFKRIE